MSRGTGRDGKLLCHQVIQAKSVFVTAPSDWGRLVLLTNVVENITWAKMCKGFDQKEKASILFLASASYSVKGVTNVRAIIRTESETSTQISW